MSAGLSAEGWAWLALSGVAVSVLATMLAIEPGFHPRAPSPCPVAETRGFGDADPAGRGHHRDRVSYSVVAGKAWRSVAAGAQADLASCSRGYRGRVLRRDLGFTHAGRLAPHRICGGRRDLRARPKKADLAARGNPAAKRAVNRGCDPEKRRHDTFRSRFSACAGTDRLSSGANLGAGCSAVGVFLAVPNACGSCAGLVFTPSLVAIGMTSVLTMPAAKLVFGTPNGPRDGPAYRRRRLGRYSSWRRSYNLGPRNHGPCGFRGRGFAGSRSRNNWL